MVIAFGVMATILESALILVSSLAGTVIGLAIGGAVACLTGLAVRRLR